jgi:uncharacterized repeat protein (TIGR03803 family)
VSAFLKKPALTAALLVLTAASGSAQALSSVYSFTTNDAVTITSGLLLSGNSLYGTSYGDAYNGSPRSVNLSGSIFKLNTNGTGFTNFYTFTPVDQNSLTNTDGADSAAQLVISGSALYGTTERGGFYARGTIFAVNTDGTGFTNLHNFTSYTGSSSNSDGGAPSSGLVLSGNTLYGATSGGGSFGNGTIFAINTDGTGFTNIYNFTAFGISIDTNSDGAGAKSALILSNGILYGTADLGGTAGNGTVFAMNTDGTGFTNLHNFSSLVRMTTSPYIFTNIDGANPQAALLLSGNKLYGTATMGGTSSDSAGSTTAGGTAFALNIDGTGFTNLHNFAYSTGNDPYAGLVLSGGRLYGPADAGGSITAQKDGAIFALGTDGAGFATIHTFTPTTPKSGTGLYTNADGSNPNTSMIMSGSTLYGATQHGGTNGEGTIFALNLAATPPTIQFTVTPSNGVPPLSVQLNSPAVDSANNSILVWNWNFGDGSAGTTQNPTHIYTNAGAYFPTLVCVNTNGDSVTGSGPSITAAYPSTILNGGFETGTFSNWTQSGDYFYSGAAGGATYTHSGKYGAALETGGTIGFLSQTLTTTPGGVYLISFWFDNPRKFTATNDFQVLWNGNLLLNETNQTVIGWTNIQFTVTASATLSTLQFGYLNDYFYFGLDDVSVTPAVAPLAIASLTLSGSNLVITGINGQSNATYYILTSTNLSQPLTQWTPIATNQLNTTGNFTLTATNALDRTTAHRYYILELP